MRSPARVYFQDVIYWSTEGKARRLLAVPLVVFCATVAAVTASTPALAAEPHDLTIEAPQQLSLSAPPYQAPGITVTYGERATLLQARNGATAVNLDVSKKPIPPGRGYRWVGLRLRLTNTGSQDSGGGLIPEITGSDGQVYYGSDATMPGCAQLATYLPRLLAPGQTITACDTYLLPDRVAARTVTISMGFANPAANGLWQLSTGPLPWPARPVSYAALGDSYSSGEGSGDYDAHPASCHRGADAWPRLTARQLPGLVRMRLNGLIACSGATSAALTGGVKDQPDQILALRDFRLHPSLVTITMGGNDIGFVPILTNCVATLGGCVADGRISQAEADVVREQRVLVSDYRKIHAADPGAVILAVGYPRLFPLRQSGVVSCGLWLHPDVRLALNQLDADLNAIVHDAAAQAGLRYVDVSNALSGHEACTAHSWLYPFLHPLSDQQSGHPIKAGQQAIAGAVESYFRQQP